MAATALVDVSTKGEFLRKDSVFRNAIAASSAPYPPAKGRYLLIVSYACPWASRCLALRTMKGLEDAIEVAVVSPVWGQTRPDVDAHEGWLFDASYDDATTADPVLGAPHVRHIYEECIAALGGGITTRFTVPILFDKQTRTIVNNESSEIIRFLNTEFNDYASHPEVDLYPGELRGEIDAMNAANYDAVCNGVYRCGFAQSQEAYDAALGDLTARLQELERLLGTRRYLCGPHVTEADIRLFVTVVRFDEVYVVHFKCNSCTIREMPNLLGWMRDVYQSCGLAPTVNMKHIKEHYYRSHRTLNPFGIVPRGPAVSLDEPHGRDARPYA